MEDSFDLRNNKIRTIFWHKFLSWREVFQLNIHKVGRHGRKVFYIYEDKANEDGYIFT